MVWPLTSCAYSKTKPYSTQAISLSPAYRIAVNEMSRYEALCGLSVTADVLVSSFGLYKMTKD